MGVLSFHSRRFSPRPFQVVNAARTNDLGFVFFHLLASYVLPRMIDATFRLRASTLYRAGFSLVK